MKTVTSEDNLSGYFLGQRRSGEVIDISKLNRKIKSIKAALKLAEQHNEDLHAKIKHMRENHQLEIVQYETQCTKYRQLYEMLSQNYELRALELKESKKRLKKAEAEQARTAGTQITLQQAEETTKEYRQAIIKQQRELGRLRQENRALYQQIYDKASRIKDYEHVLARGYSPSKGEAKDKVFLLNLRSALQAKNEQFDKVLHEKAQLLNAKAAQDKEKTLLEKEAAELHLKLAKMQAELEFSRKSEHDLKERLGRQQKEAAKLQDQLKNQAAKYSELLSFSYEVQKDFEKELHAMGKQLSRKEIIRT